MYIIGISSNCYGAGKTTLAEGLVSMINDMPGMSGAASIVSFASPIKDSALHMVECIAGRGPFDKTQVILGKDVTYRDVLLGIGQLARTWDPDFWLKAALYEMKRRSEAEGGPSVFIVDDMRFPNEFAYIKKHGLIGSSAESSCSVYLTHEGYDGGAQNEAEGLLDPSLFDIRVIRSAQSRDKKDALVNVRRIFTYIKDDLEFVRMQRGMCREREFAEIS